MRVDGFRFDLAPVLARTGLGDVNLYAPFLGAIRQDPVLADVKIIAEAWDVGPDGYLVGRFPRGLGRVERPLPGRRASLLARRRRAGR
jgi:glycogen operon protein